MIDFIKNIFQCKHNRNRICASAGIGIGNHQTNFQPEMIPLSALRQDEYKELSFLVIDDSADQRNIITFFVNRFQGTADCAVNGEIGLQMYLATPNKYDIILMDIQMPVMNGTEAAKQIRASDTFNAQSIPIIAISGNTAFDEINESSGFNFYLKKPFKMEQLAYIIHRSCNA